MFLHKNVHLLQNHFSARSQVASCELSRTLFALMSKKQSNLIVSADVATCASLLSLCDSIGPYVVCVKTHADTLSGEIRLQLNLPHFVARRGLLSFFCNVSRCIHCVSSATMKQYRPYHDQTHPKLS